MRDLVLSASLLLAGCYLSHERPLEGAPASDDGGADAARRAPLDCVLPSTACEDGPAHSTDSIDLLLVIDDSPSMDGEQERLAAELPRLVERWTSGDLDGDGVADSPVAASVRVGVVSTDLGTGHPDVPGCTPAGDGARLACRGEAAPEARAGCGGGPAPCAIPLGAQGCAFEQPLEAALEALSPDAAATFFDGAPGRGTLENAGWLRPGSLLAILVLTDEDDCSARSPALYDPSSETYELNLNLRCYHEDQLQPVERYVEGLLALRDDPSRLVLGLDVHIDPALAGMRPGSIPAPERYSDRDPPPGPCGWGPWPGRLLGVAAGLEERGAYASVSSLCATDDPLRDFAVAVGSRLRRPCRR